MKVILLQDVKNVGKKGQTVEVSDGYGTNFLLPRRLAVLHTSKSVEVLNEQNQKHKEEEALKKANAEKIAEKLASVVVIFEVNSSGDGRMFGSISHKQVEEKLKQDFDITIDKRKFIDKQPVNSLGFTRLKIELYKGVVGEITVQVKEKE